MFTVVHLFHPGSQVLDKELPQIVQSLQFFGLKSKKDKQLKSEYINTSD